MAKRKRKPDVAPSTEAKPKRPPSRENTRYVALPKDLHRLLEQFARQHSDVDDKKTVSWAARHAVRKFLQSEGLWPPASS